MGPLFDPLSTTEQAAAALSDAAWVRAMLDTEAALARAQAACGLVPAEVAAVIGQAARGDFDAAAIGRQAVAAANPVVPLVRALRAAVPDAAARHVHRGATSQDVLDTAAVLLARRAAGLILADLAALAGACARLAEAHRGSVLAGRTLLQQAVPTTFGLKAAGWLVAVDEARQGLAEARQRLTVQYGGASGTLASLGGAGVKVLEAFAAELDLPAPVLPWHTNRVRLAHLAGALGAAAGAAGKIALDVVLLAQTEVAELAEPAGAGRGGSSTMPHKQNPVGAVLAAACARRVPGLVATLLAAMAQEHERAAGAWQAEWETVRDLLRLTAGAAGHLRPVLTGLRVDTDRMRANLALTRGLPMAENLAEVLAGVLGRAEAHEVVAAASRRAGASGRSLREALLDDPAVRDHLTADHLDAALDPAAYLGSAARFVDRALAHHRTLPTAEEEP